MHFLSPQLAWLLLGLFSVLWIFFGFILGRKSKNLEGYALAGRNVGLALGAATAVATWITSNTTLLAPQFALQMGVWGMIAYATACIGLFLFAPVASRVSKLMPKGFTSGDFIRLRYGKLAWGIFVLISLFYSLTWLISMGMAGGILLNALAGIPYAVGVTVILFTCIAYTLLGGLYAVIGTDYVQSIIILIGILILGFAVLSNVDIQEVHTNLVTNQPALLFVFFPAAIMAIFNNLLFGIGEVFHSNVWWSRAFAIRKGLGGKAYFLAGLFWLPIPVAAGFIALAGGALGVNVSSPDMIGPLVAATILGKFGAVAIFVIVFCSLASSIDSLLAATSDFVTNDIYHHYFRPSATDDHVYKVARWIVVLIGLGAWLVCLPRVATLAEVFFFAGPLVGSVIWPIITGLYWRRANTFGACAGMLAGSIVGLVAYFTIGWFTASLIGTVVSMVVVLISTLFKSSEFDWQKLNEIKTINEG